MSIYWVHLLVNSLSLGTLPTLVAMARTTQLTGQVQEARVRTASVCAEERHRLRRKPHDGPGPVLASLCATSPRSPNACSTR